ncbi:MAG TPA: glucoamylase family protein [Gemmatimonadales bacterium]|nr:glucoamylase family protein [Gemmatimonadales bacterium]
MRVPLPIFFPSLPPLEDPIRAELFGIERLEQHAESLAAAQPVAAGRAPRKSLLPRVDDNGRVLREANRAIAEAVREEHWITPAAEWLVDNFFVVDEQIREIRDDLPVGFYRELPALADGPLSGYPRVYGIAWAFVAHTDSRFDPDTLRRFVKAYQRVQPLNIGELWALTISLRVVLVENLRRVADAMVRGRAARQEADALADELLGKRGQGLQSVAAVMSRDDSPRLVTAFAVELVQRLRDQDPAVTPALAWLRQRLAAQGTSAEEIALVEHQRQAAMTVTVRNIITSMRLMSALDWTAFFEGVSLVDEVLRAGSAFAAMDFTGRDSYRHAIEVLARGSGRTELDVTQEALGAADRARGQSADGGGTVDERRCDPGYYLVGAGRRAFERLVNFRPPWRLRLRRAFIDAATPGYLGTLFIVTVAILAVPLALTALGDTLPWRLLVLGALGLIPASDLAVALVNRFVNAVVVPRPLPRLEWAAGVPEQCRTLVAVPTLLIGVDDAEEQVERLEVHYLANSDGDVRFALASDWLDAATEHAAGDEEILSAARNAVARLNARHGPAPGGGDRFFVFHRRRLWNASQRVWMGWERKRGKLHELNRLLRGARDTTYIAANGDVPVAPGGVRYVITLDADTRVPIGAVQRLVGTMAHPLNRPRLDRETRRVVEGYAILQPRVTPPLPGRMGSRFQRLSSGMAGIDPYAAAVSDVYQDLFGEGSYTGKGIYDVDAFETALAGRVPDNSLLSHDLFEGLFARAGLVTDVELLESAPGNYLAAAARQHRWARGDWQLLPWIVRERLSPVGRWKMIDNLRRTLSLPAAFLTLVAGWVVPGPGPVLWTAFILAVIAIPPLLPVSAGLWPRAPGIAKRSHVRAVASDFRSAVSQMAVTCTTLPHQAWLMGDAILRTLGRISLTHRRLLEWRTMTQAASHAPTTAAGFYRRMSGGMVLTAIAAATVGWLDRGALPVALPLLAAWGLAPAVMSWMSRPGPGPRTAQLSANDARALRLIARRTWGYFTTFVTAENHHLPPDNFQETPQPVIAQRTSPTNIGLYLLSVVSARDLGWIGTLDAVDRIEATLRTITNLEHYRGHLYNWYDTRDGRALEPKYISTVDSGNLAGALITLGNACREMLGQGVPLPDVRSGIADAANFLEEAVRAGADEGEGKAPWKRLSEALEVVMTVVGQPSGTPAAWAARLAELAAATQAVANRAQDTRQGVPAQSIPLLTAAEALRGAVETHERDLDTLMPWASSRPDDRAAALMNRLQEPLTLAELPPLCQAALEDLATVRTAVAGAVDGTPARLRALDALAASLERSAASATALIERLNGLAAQASDMVAAMDFGFVFDPTRMLFAIGFRMGDRTLDPGRYDLLASEARLLSFIAIAKGDVPVRHWFRLSRLLTPVGRDSVLLSWSGSMFEYLMPGLIMRSPLGSLLEQSCRLAVQRQMDYGAERKVPWGMSESGYYARDLAMTFQYSSFGVPGLGLKRGLVENVVVAPYATALAAMVDPEAALRNFRALARAGADGLYGFCEAVDYTPSRLPADTEQAVVRMYMAHHQGMSVVALANVLTGDAMRARFHHEPMVRATELLLQERTPRDVPVARPQTEADRVVGDVRELVPPQPRHFTSPDGATPRTQVLSNGRYAVMVTAAGSGYSRWRDLAVTRWREDVTCDDAGSYILLRDVESGDRWSAGFQPAGSAPESYDVSFAEDRAEFSRRDGAITTRLEVIVSSEDDAEVRRVSLTNNGARIREIDVTSYAEIVLAPPAADAAHPAFSNLFLETESVAERDTLLATRRRRAPEDAEVWLAHVLAVEGETVGDLEWETDRAQFLGRGGTLRAPRAETEGGHLSNTVGSVLDPIVSLRRRVRVRAGRTVRVAFTTLVGPSRAAVLDLADKYHDVTTFERVATLAWTQAQVQLHHLGIEPAEAHLFQTLSGALLYTDRALRGPTEVQVRRHEGVTALWAHGISGDLPIVLVEIDESDDIGIVRQLLRAHAYWRLKGLAVDLVILNDRAPSYEQDLQGLIETLVRTNQSMPSPEGPDPQGRVIMLRADRVTAGQRDVLESVARIDLSSRRGTLVEQVARAHRADPPPTPVTRREPAEVPSAAAPAAPSPRLEFFNGVGGFDAETHEYVITLRAGQWTPAPWINVLANPDFGCLVSESGSGCTWAINSQENVLTPWSNDPVRNPPSDMFYIRDDESGALWSPTPLPIREPGGEYVVRHGRGYTRFRYDAHGVTSEILQFVPADDPVKISRLTLTNQASHTRHLSVTAYHDWVLGTSRSASAPFIMTELDPATGAMFARNSWSRDFATRIAFADLGGGQVASTGDRTEFLGRNGGLDRPAALIRRQPLSGRIGAALDPGCALQVTVDIPPGASVSVVWLLGQTDTREQARAVIQRYRSDDLDRRLATVIGGWSAILETIQVTTPDRALDLMLNQWLLYQTLACRLWARTAFYQASGAYGFRDQLQDVMALAVTRPDLMRAHILKAASRQFVEGDVQHWWHEPVGRGVRTRISDDLLWLPYVVGYYLEVTGDQAILDEVVPFLGGALLAAGQSESYFEPRPAAEHGTLFEHCGRALDRSLGVGAHGLPLMGTGDWNDGMNRVGSQGRGESVWLAWFLHSVLRTWAPIAATRGEAARAAAWGEHGVAVTQAVEQEAWDGNWYRRAYFDDGTPLGVAGADACAIDSIAQSWSVLSGGAGPERARRAMASVDERLVRRSDDLILLLTPPFDRTALEPGYIKGYVPGVRENGGQYTHAAVWAAIAFAQLGDGAKAAELFAMLNPISHTATAAGVQRYRVEPYVAVGDVYSEPPHVGRGGWSWYSGSAGWLYRAGVEWLLGLRVRSGHLLVDPCIPPGWSGFTAVLRHGEARYEISVENPARVCRGVVLAELDGVALDHGAGVLLVTGKGVHRVRVVMGATGASRMPGGPIGAGRIEAVAE